MSSLSILLVFVTCGFHLTSNSELVLFLLKAWKKDSTGILKIFMIETTR